MHPEQIKKAIDELWLLTQNPQRPASEIINDYIRARRYIGSNDRRLITQAVWEKWRQKDYPLWISKKIKNFDTQLVAMRQNQAPTTLRVNGDRLQVKSSLEKKGVSSTLTHLSPLGLILSKRIQLQALPEYKSGLIEVQDEGSQMIGLETGIKEGNCILELCAGAGGKSLLFAQIMQNKGQILAYDISQRSLVELQKRALRAKASIIKTIFNLPDEKQKFDYVVVDAPCSGTGTFRRSPDNVHKITPLQFEKLLLTQKELLQKASLYVKEKGKICYMTCSLTEDENEKQVASFLGVHKEYKLTKEKSFSPALTQTDGFYLAILSKK